MSSDANMTLLSEESDATRARMAEMAADRDTERVAMMQRIAEMSEAMVAERAAGDARLLAMEVVHAKMLETMERLTQMASMSNTLAARTGQEESSGAWVVANRVEKPVVDKDPIANIADL